MRLRHSPPSPRQVLELACSRESDKVYDAGGLPAVMELLINHAHLLHQDTQHSCMAVVMRLIARVEPKEPSLEPCVASLSSLLRNHDPHISELAMRCFVTLADRFIRRGHDPAPIAAGGLVPVLVGQLEQIGQLATAPVGVVAPEKPSGHTVTTIVNLLSTLCRGSPTITRVSRPSAWSRPAWREGLSDFTLLFLSLLHHLLSLFSSIISLSSSIISSPPDPPSL